MHAVDKQHVKICGGWCCAGVVRSRQHSPLDEAVCEPRGERARQSGELLSIIRVSGFETQRFVVQFFASACETGQRKLRAKAFDQRKQRCNAIGPAFGRCRIEQRMGSAAEEQRAYEDGRRALEGVSPMLRIETGDTADDETAPDRRVDDDFFVGVRREPE